MHITFFIAIHYNKIKIYKFCIGEKFRVDLRTGLPYVLF